MGAGGGASLAIRTATSPVKEPHKGVGEWLLCLFLNDTTRVDGGKEMIFRLSQISFRPQQKDLRKSKG